MRTIDSKLAVKFYNQFPDHPHTLDGIPGDWPCEVIELPEGTDTAPAGWTIMTVGEYRIYKAERQAPYDAWYDAPPRPWWKFWG